MTQPIDPELNELPILDNGLGFVCADFASSIIRAIGESGLKIQITRGSDSLANRACNGITNAFLRGRASHLIIIDTDIITTGDHLRMLCSHDAELVYGTYPKRQPNHEMCLAVLKDGDRPDPAVPLWEVRRAGRGYVRIARSLLEKMKEDNGGPALRYHNNGVVEWDFWPCGVIEGPYATVGMGTDKDGFMLREFISEDWGFCDRARMVGVPVLVDWRIQTTHIGQCHFPINYHEGMLPHILSHFPAHVIKRNWEQVEEIRKPAKTWDQIEGWFDGHNRQMFDVLVDRIPNGGRFAEVGSWLGRSAAYFATRCREKEKEIEINCIDTWRGSTTEPCKRIQQPILETFKDGSMLPAFIANMKATASPVRIHEGNSVKMADSFADKSLDAVYLDGDHTYAGVTEDIVAWLPKVKPGGIICGDDYGDTSFGVTEAVNAYFGEKVRHNGRVWVVEVEA